LGFAIFSEWICKMAVPETLETNLTEDKADQLQQELADLLQCQPPQATFVDSHRGHHFNLQAEKQIRRMVNTAELSWEDFIPALNFAHNTSYQSVISSTPFEHLYGYKPVIPKSTLEAISTPSSFATERLLILKKAIEQIQQEVEAEEEKEKKTANNQFHMHQEVFFSETSFGQQYWTGPATIIEFKNERIRISFGKNKKRWISPLRLRPKEDFQKQGEGYVLKIPQNPHQANPIEINHPHPNHAEEQAISAIHAANHQPSQLIKNLTLNQLEAISRQEALINLIDIRHRPYLLELSHKLFTSSSSDIQPLTSSELAFWTSFDPQERATLLTGNPLGIPEYRTQLCAFSKKSAAPPSPPPAPAPLVPAPVPPIPIGRSVSAPQPATLPTAASSGARTSNPSSPGLRTSLEQKAKDLRRAAGKTLKKLTPNRSSLRIPKKERGPTARFYVDAVQGPDGSTSYHF
jgi:hypothetical protein